MMRAAALLCLTLMSVLILSWGLPQLYDMALLKSLDKTHAFFSPVLKKFIYTEQRGRKSRPKIRRAPCRYRLQGRRRRLP